MYPFDSLESRRVAAFFSERSVSQHKATTRKHCFIQRREHLDFTILHHNYFTTMSLYIVFLAFLMSMCSPHSCSAAKTREVFYVLGFDGIYVIDPVEKRLVTKITNSSSPGLCTMGSNRRSRTPCSFSQASVVNQSFFVADVPGSAVKVIDLTTQSKTETIPTDPNPYGLYLVPWRKELWVHSWTNSTFDVIDTESRNRTHNAVRAHIRPGWTHGIMLAHNAIGDGNTAYVTHLFNSGFHKINLQSKTYSGYINLTSLRCTGTYGIAYSPVNDHLFVQCRKRPGNSILEVDVANDSIVKNWNILGSPFVSPNGRYIVVLYGLVNETSNTLLDSRMNVLEITGSGVSNYPELRIPGGVSKVTFYPKKTNASSYYAFVTLKFDSKIAVVDLDLAKNGNLSDVQYIENVDELDTSRHGASRVIVSGGKWIVSPASRSKSVVIIDADTHEVHGKVQDVNGGDYTVWVDAGANETIDTSLTKTTTDAGPSGGTNAGCGVGAPRVMVFIGVLVLFLMQKM